ncbi:RING-type E3 ubiquitin-protein ligase PPIL2-like [Sycon ciliatum]|uniref:RING-type E3 ubiquitin-protein ligase PPIL2-like n=1 Tax=Sycon ciliatum TaxID=27933 RepID=UPI0020AB5D3A|eukprot:scpid66634/ scgid10711/ Peptidyl-prolyl cis-trans isomerase-like 2; Cyclophilin-60; Cyclophilin-like protein Cyp-60; Rotamase PPIL2
MGKKQHQKDKMYLTTTEWSTLFGGKKAAAGDQGKNASFRRLPFDCCSLSLQPTDNPYCTAEGVVFDLLNIVPYLKKFGRNPVNGERLDSKSLIRLNFHKNAEGKYHCPVMFKVFNENTHIVAVKTTGNVFSMEAVEQLNIKRKHFKDLLTDEAFVRADIIHLQDPTNLDKFNLASFHHLKNSLKVENEDGSSKNSTLKNTSAEAKYILEELDKTYQPEKSEDSQPAAATKATDRNAAHFSTGRMAASFTSSTLCPVTEQEAAVVSDEVIRYQKVKKRGAKGYVQIKTNHGDLNLEIHCEMVPKTAENFILHCKAGYYKNTVFHRSIRNFMIQGGDPSGTGRGGESAFGEPFADEFKPNLVHQGRGVLSMANSGPKTNKSQFFITFRSCRHLDNKHSVFGRVVGGLDAITSMEKVECDDKDRPTEPIEITDCSVFVNPFDDVDAEMTKEKETEEATIKQKAEAERLRKSGIGLDTEFSATAAKSKAIGKYLPTASKRPASQVQDSSTTTLSSPSSTQSADPGVKKKKVGSGGFSNFSSW